MTGYLCGNRFCHNAVRAPKTFCCKACSTYRGEPRKPVLRLTHCANCRTALAGRQTQYCSPACAYAGSRSPHAPAVWRERAVNPDINIDQIAAKLGITSNQARSALYRTVGRPQNVRIKKLGPRKDPW